MWNAKKDFTKRISGLLHFTNFLIFQDAFPEPKPIPEISKDYPEPVVILISLVIP